MYVITGATGQLGGAVIERLLERVPAEQLGVSVRDPEKASGLAERGVRVRRGDFDDPATLATAFEGATRLLLISAGNPNEEQAERWHRAAVGAARRAGVQRIVYTSHMGVSPTSPFTPMHTHAATESLLEQSGIPYTSLRNGFYTATTLRLLGPALKTGELAVPEDGPVSWTAHPDLADAAASILIDGGFEGPTPPLTNTDAYDLADIAAMASEVTGTTIARVMVGDEDYRDVLLSHGTPEPVANLLVGMFKASRQGEFAATDPALEELIGRPPLAPRDVLAEAL